MDRHAHDWLRSAARGLGVGGYLGLLLLGCLAVAEPAIAQGLGGDGSRVKLTEVPQNFERWQDSKGYSWQLTRQGAMLSGGVPYFQGAMKLIVDGKEFTASSGMRLDGGEADEDGARVVLSGAAGGLQVSRDVWLDSARGGIRYLDVVENPDAQPMQVEVKFSTAYQNPWQDLHAGDGRVLGTGSSAGLRGRDSAVLIKFSQAEGRHDTLLLVADETFAEKPQLALSENHRELSLTYDLEIPGGGKVALVHWIMQRGMQAAREAEAELRPFYLRRRLVEPAVADGLTKQVVNFSIRATDAAPDPKNLARLVKLNEVLATYGIQRSADDVLWIGPTNQLAGNVDPALELKVATRFGEKVARLSEFAAIQGGGGFGRVPRLYLRDGRVWAGAVTLSGGGLSLVSPDGVTMSELKVADIELLLLRQGGDDGLPPLLDGEGGDEVSFVALRSGDVLSLATSEGTQLEVLSPWGSDSVAVDEIVALNYVNANAPKFRLRRSDGSQLTVFVSGGSGALFDNGSAGAADIIGLWRAGSEPMLAAVAEGLEELWLEVEDVGDVEGMNLPVALLQGNNLLRADLESKELHLVSGNSVTRLVPAEIESLRRSEDTVNEADPHFEIELRGGDRLTGRLRERIVALRSASRVWQVPVQHFNAYQGERVE